MNSFGVAAVLFALVPAVLWLIIGWRAMRAHERIADSLEMLHLQLDQQRQRTDRDQHGPA